MRDLSERTTSDPHGESRVKPSFRDGANINSIMKKYRRSGTVPNVNLKTPFYGDFTNVDDYLTAVTKVRQAKEGFAALPSEVRNLVDNDPAKFLAWVTNKENKAAIVNFKLASQEQADIIWPPSESESSPEASTPSSTPEATA